MSSASSSADEFETHWVTGSEYAPLLVGHPRLAKIWSFDRKGSIFAWAKFCKKLWDEDYAVVVDLHLMIRSRVARLLFHYWDWRAGRRCQYLCLSKQRLRTWGYFAFKALWPRSLRPRPVTSQFAIAAGGSGEERPDLSHLVTDQSGQPQEVAEFRAYSNRSLFAVMPSSNWEGKNWPTSKYLEVAQAEAQRGRVPVVFGSKYDRPSIELVEALAQARIEFVSGVGKWTLPMCAAALAGCDFYLGNDTGMAHLAEAVGTQAFFLFGPNVPEAGFGPWRKESVALGSSLWCRPCGKDGRFCFRIRQRHRCIKEIASTQVVQAIDRANGAEKPEIKASP